jgi:hypothetical protein
MVAVVLLAAMVALLIRLYDTPSGPFDYKTIALSFAASLVAAFLTAWMSMESGLDIFSFAGFAVIAGAAVGGISAIGALIGGARAVVVQ